MKHVYVAFDGTTYPTEAECLEHEANHLAYRAFDEDGEITYELEDARAVYIYSNGADKLMDDLEQMDRPWSGISCYSTGWFHLCECCDEWSPISENFAKLLGQGTP